MRFNTYINNTKCLEWGLNANQGALFDLLNQISSWADEVIHNNQVFYHISRNKVLKEIPLFYSKSDTVYRHFKILHEKELIIYEKSGIKDLIKLTDKGKSWNSEMNPNFNEELGNESEQTRKSIRINSDSNPTYNNTIHNNTNNNICANELNLDIPIIKKEEKEKKVSTKKEKEFNPPTEKEVLDYFNENGYTEEAAKKAFKYYETGEWKDARGNKVRNWKQKIIAVWFRPENKIIEADKNSPKFDIKNYTDL